MSRKWKKSGSIRIGELEPLFRDPKDLGELDVFLSSLESSAAKLLPDFDTKPALPPTQKEEYLPLQVYLREVGKVPSMSLGRKLSCFRALLMAPKRQRRKS